VDAIVKRLLADQTGQKKFLTPESMGVRKEYFWKNGTWPVKERNETRETTHPPQWEFCCL